MIVTDANGYASMKPIIAEQLNVNEAEIKPETKFKDDLAQIP